MISAPLIDKKVLVKSCSILAFMDPFAYSLKNVVVGSEDYLFLYNGGHHVHSYHTGVKAPSENSICNFITNLENRAALCKLKNIEYYHLLFPNKQSSLSYLYPANISSVLDIFLTRLRELDYIIDFRKDLSEYGPKVWLKTDTHLNQLGEILCAISVAQKLFGMALDGDLELITSDPFVRNRRGDLSFMLGDDGVHRVEQETLYRPRWPRHQFCNSMSGGNNGLIDIYINSSAMDDRRVIMFDDSFGRGVASGLSYFFSHTIFCRTPFMHCEIINSYSPDIVLTQGIERYLPSTTLDDEMPMFLLFPLIGKHWKKLEGDQAFYAALNAELCYPRKHYKEFMDRLC